MTVLLRQLRAYIMPAASCLQGAGSRRHIRCAVFDDSQYLRMSFHSASAIAIPLVFATVKASACRLPFCPALPCPAHFLLEHKLAQHPRSRSPASELHPLSCRPKTGLSLRPLSCLDLRRRPQQTRRGSRGSLSSWINQSDYAAVLGLGKRGSGVRRGGGRSGRVRVAACFAGGVCERSGHLVGIAAAEPRCGLGTWFHRPFLLPCA